MKGPPGRGVVRGAPGSVSLCSVVAIAAMLASTTLPPLLCWDIAWTSAAVGALVGLWVARNTADRANRNWWTQLTIAAGCFLTGQLAWDLFGLTGTPQSPNAADIGYWGFAVFVAASMLR